LAPRPDPERSLSDHLTIRTHPGKSVRPAALDLNTRASPHHCHPLISGTKVASEWRRCAPPWLSSQGKRTTPGRKNKNTTHPEPATYVSSEISRVRSCSGTGKSVQVAALVRGLQGCSPREKRRSPETEPQTERRFRLRSGQQVQHADLSGHASRSPREGAAFRSKAQHNQPHAGHCVQNQRREVSEKSELLQCPGSRARARPSGARRKETRFDSPG
jgi:hypothetical protein